MKGRSNGRSGQAFRVRLIEMQEIEKIGDIRYRRGELF
jgi:hypothetical protein